MRPSPYELLARKRGGESLAEADLRSIAQGAASGDWGEAELGAFLMAAAIQGLDAEETGWLTEAMLDSGERWRLCEAVPGVVDKHSTGGVGDNVSLVLAPLLAAVGVPVVMLTGRALGHTGGTADKLEVIPGLDLSLDRDRCLRLLRDPQVGAAVGIATHGIAPADRRLYALRDRTATVDSLPLIVASILSKKLASGAAAVVFDVKTGSGAFLRERAAARLLAERLVGTCRRLATASTAFLTDMSQPLGRWSGHACEVREALQVLEGNGPIDLRDVSVELSLEAAQLGGWPVDRPRLVAALADGSARERFDRWALAQGADAGWIRRPTFDQAPVELVIVAETSGVLEGIEARRLGLLLGVVSRPTAATIDPGVSLEMLVRLGDEVRAGEPLCRFYLRQEDDELAAKTRACFQLAPLGTPVEPPRLIERLP